MHQASRRQANAGANTQPRLPGFRELNGRPIVSTPQFMKDMDMKDDNARRRPSSGTDRGLSQASRKYRYRYKLANPVKYNEKRYNTWLESQDLSQYSVRALSCFRLKVIEASKIIYGKVNIV